MSVRKKTLIIICLTFLALLGILYFTAQWFMLKEAIVAEGKSTTRDVTRLLAALDDQIAVMDANVGDWAPWDDTYAFINNGDTAYIDSNLPNVTFTNLGVELMLFINNSGQIVFGKMVDLESEAEIPIPEGLYSQLQVGSRLLSHKDPADKLAGILSLPEGPMIIASQPIVTSQGEGPSRGTLIMGRRLDEAEIAKLTQRTQLSISVFPYNDDVLPEDVALARNSLVGVKPIFIAPQSEKVVSGYTLVNDVYGNPALILRVDSPREAYSQAKMSGRTLGLALLASGIVLGMVTMLLLDRMVIIRLTSLTSSVLKIGSQGTASSRVEANGNDEINVLATSVNSMLDSLESSLAKERESEERFRSLYENATIGMYRTTPDGHILMANPKLVSMLGYESFEELSQRDLAAEGYEPKYPRREFQERIEGDGEVRGLESAWKRKDGSIIYVRESAHLVRNENNQPLYYEGTVEDISGRKQAEEALRENEEKFRNLFNNAEVGMFRTRIDGSEILDMNERFLTIYGRTRAEMQGSASVLHWADPREREEMVRRLEAEDYVEDFECGMLNKEGEVRRCLTSLRVYRAEGILEGSILDITERKRNELIQNAIYRITQAAITSDGIDALYYSIHSILGELIPAENFYIALYDSASNLISFPYFVDQYDEPPSEPTKIRGLTGYVIRSGRPLLATREIFDRLVQKGGVEAVGTVGVDWMGAPLKAEGRMIGVMAVQSYTEGIHFDQEDLNLLEFVSTQVAQAIERKRMEEEIRSLSLTDELTGLYNRRGFTLLAEQEVKLAHRFKRSVLLFFGDVDGLKVINDTHGHAQGDLALKEVSAILKETFREADIPARFGGDEFVVLAVDASIESAEIVTNRLQADLDARNQRGDRPYQLTLSMGIAQYDPEAPCTVSELIVQADGLMYQQKQARKGKKEVGYPNPTVQETV